MPCDYSKYPNDWKEIRAAILERAGHECEECGVSNYAIGARDRNDLWHNENDIHTMNSSYGFSLFGDFPKVIKIILTISHTDHDIANNDHGNLKALCQRCHNRHDAAHRSVNAAKTRARKRGQMTLFQDTTL